MNLTSRSRYALKIMLDLSNSLDDQLVKRHDIVARQGIPVKYLDQILLRLRRGGLIESIRGRSGGYKIARGPQVITVWEVFRAVEDGLYPALCLDKQTKCDHQDYCSSSEPWHAIFNTIRSSLTAITLTDLNMPSHRQPKTLLKEIFECKPGLQNKPERSWGGTKESKKQHSIAVS